MLSHSPWYTLSRKFVVLLFAIVSCAFCYSSTIEIHPGQNIPAIVADNPAGTTFLIYPGTYRLTEHIVPKSGDSFIGQTACAPPASTCPAILTGSRVIGSLATYNGVNYQVTGQTQQGLVTLANTSCQPGYLACNLPEDLFFDGVPYRRLYAAALPAIGSKEWWFNYATNIIYFHDSPAGHVVETSVLDTAFLSTANNITIQYLTLRGFATPLQRGAIETSSGNLSASNGLNWVIKNCALYNNHGAAVRVGFGMHVLSNYLYNNGALGIDGGTNSTVASGIVIQANTISGNNYAKVYSATGAGGFKVGYTAHLVLRGNTITNNDGTGVHFDANSQSPLVDGNTITNNAGGAGIGYEISVNSATIRNNIVLRNAIPDAVPISTAGINSVASVGTNTYCNVIEVPNSKGANGFVVIASDRGYNFAPPYEYLMSTGNSFHHNTVFWDAGAVGAVGYQLSDVAHQPNFFKNNTAPDNNTYHLPSLSDVNFIYDNNDTGLNTRKTFSEYQAAGADVHGSADTNTGSGYPTVKITSPVDQSSFTDTVTVEATASDKSGINRVEFYVDWALKATIAGPPYNFDWTGATAGTHTVTAMAFSNAGIRSCYAVTLTDK
ncbi:MAG TPA: Ig-like domain-containing protein [Verrucomicrobiae bacterium]|nr:Ig-like domain-containing protein [Verrucomicrobiae bacterium]